MILVRGRGGEGGVAVGEHVRGKAALVSVMYAPKARMRRGSDHVVASRAREESSFSRRSLTCVRAGQARMACWKDSGPVSHRGQVGSGFSSDHEGWAAR